jgi:chaperonin cofactor prefoldin
MSVVDMAKAHLQNVHARIEELKNQKKLIDDEINKLTSYIQKGLEEIEELEDASDSEKVSNK